MENDSKQLMDSKRTGGGLAKKIGLSTTIVLLAVVIGVRQYIHWRYPYGWSHCCIKILTMALRIYSGDNAENYPTGGSTPEESLSLLSRGSYLGSLEDSADILRGKTVPLEVALKALHENGKLGPDTCGWHYTEGLTDQDDPQIAVVWDKIGLGHNGERWSEAGHEVGLIDGSERFVTAKEWPAFLEHQRALLAARTNSPRGVGQSNANAAQSGSRVGSSK